MSPLKVHNQCEELVAEWVSDKERANYCDYFAFSEGGGPVPWEESRRLRRPPGRS
ncbi:MAG TPA: hypothetical protein VKL61_06605 [Candidatus Polarisedimenticolia bacterium]|nr:hypothetical protein [Candidatus Polarisedimenticolia bacterium]